MNIRQLETFLAIVRLGSFAAAAARLNSTQSTVSARVQELEQDLGVLLFDRSHRRAHLTAKGRELVAYAERAVAIFSEIKHRVGTRDALSGVVRLGVSELIALTWLPALAAVIRERYPKLTLELDVSLTFPLLKALREGDLDIILVPGSSFDPSFRALSLGSVPFAWMASGTSPTRPGVLAPRDLASWRVLSLGSDSFHSSTVESWLTLQGDVGQHVDLCNSMAVIASLTAAGYGISLLPPCCYINEVQAGALQVLDTSPPGPDVECFAVYSSRGPAPLPELIAELAIEASTFEQAS